MLNEITLNIEHCFDSPVIDLAGGAAYNFAAMKRLSHHIILLLFISSGIVTAIAQAPQPGPARNVLVVTMDGMRWQEVFGGMTAELLTQKEGGVSDAARKKSEDRFAGTTPEERRAKLLPFIWTVVAKNGQVFGDPSKGSDARVTNGMRFSYRDPFRLSRSAHRQQRSKAQPERHRPRMVERPAGIHRQSCRIRVVGTAPLDREHRAKSHSGQRRRRANSRSKDRPGACD